MTPYTQASRALADRLRAGRHELSNHDLRQAYGLGRVTVKARTEIAGELRQAGLEILSDPRQEPLIVRKLAPARVARPPRPSRRAWWRRPWVIAATGLVLLFVMIGALSGEEPTAAPEPGQAAQGTPTASEPAATPEPQTIADANAAIRADDYDAALTIASELGEDTTRAVERRIARRLAYRASRAVRTNRRIASQLLREARDYPSTAEVRSARRALDAAQARASARAEAKRRAQAAARRKREARAEARRQARADARRGAEAESVPAAPAAPEPSTSGPSTTNWCGKRDGDGDGIYCEGL